MPVSDLDHPRAVDNLWGLGWALGLISVVAWVYLIHRLGGSRPWDSRSGLALALAATSTVFTAGCLVLVGIRTAEARIIGALAAPRQDEAPR